MGVTSNFAFLAAQDERLARLGALAERYFFDDAPSTLIKLRQLGEFLAKDVAARHGLLPSNSATFDEVLRRLKVKIAPAARNCRPLLPSEAAGQ
jgi:type I restriction enzyme R subunit